MQKFLIFLINIYQNTLSPDHGPLKVLYPHGFCRFYPSCSEYAKQAILHKGSLKGLYLTFLRLLRCNPFVQPRIDTIK